MKGERSVLVAALAAIVSACAYGPTVERVYDGRVVDGRYIDPAAYAASLRGAIADAGGDANGALAAYDEALRMNPSAAEIWTRIGDVRCRANPRDTAADAAFARAIDLDATGAGAWAAKAKCAFARGDQGAARAAARRAAQEDPNADGSNVILARTAPSYAREDTRAVLVALTVTARDPLVAWDALANWAQTNGDVALWVRALRQQIHIAPSRLDAIARAAEDLAGAGEVWEAREVAAAAANADERSLWSDHPLAARLAVDEAIARVDASSASQRATRVRLSLDEVAGRAFLAGHPTLAREVASAMAGADPTAAGARWMLLASGGEDVLREAHDVDPSAAPASAAAFVAFGVALVRATSPPQAGAVLARLRHDPIVPGDDRVVRPAVTLALLGALSEDALPPDAVVELAVVRGAVPPERLMAPDARLLDTRHEYLALAVAHPAGARAKDLAARLRNAVADPVVETASALIRLAVGAPISAGAPQALLSRNSADPLLAAAALRLAERTGDRDVARRARESLRAIGGWRPNSE